MPPRLPPPRVLRLRPSTLAVAPRTPIQHHVRHHNHSSLDPSEVKHFNELAAEWWDPHGSSRLLHLMNPLRLRFIESCLRSSRTDSTAALDESSVPASAAAARTASNLRYLDVGCGGGILAESLARLKTTESVVAIDPTPGVLEVAKTHMRQDPALAGKLEYRAATIEALRDEELFDVVSDNILLRPPLPLFRS